MKAERVAPPAVHRAGGNHDRDEAVASLEASTGSAARPARRDGAIALSLGMFLLAVYLVTFSGIVRSIDELSLFAVTESLAQRGSLRPALIEFAAYHNPINPFEPGQSLLAVPLYWLARQWPQASNLHAAMLLNPVLTAANAGLLYLLGRRLGYSARASLALALAFGLATMAWPYTKSLLREPAVALLWTVAFLGLARFVEKPGWGAGALAVVPTALAAGVKVASVTNFPVVFGLLAWTLYRERRVRMRWLLGVGAAIVTLAAFLALAWVRLRGVPPSASLTGFFANPFSLSGITPWYGLLFSPGKSVFIYSPALLLGVIGWPAFFRRRPRLAVGVLLLSGAMLASLRGWGWWGGLAWGPRYLLPLFPIALLPALELFPSRWWAWVLAGVSAAYQALVSAVAWPAGYTGLFEQSPSPDTTIGLDWARWAESPAVQIVKYWGRSALDLLWLHAGLAQELKLDWALALALAAAVSLTGLAFVLVWRGQGGRLPLGAGAGALVLAVPFLLWRGYWHFPDYPGLSADTARRLASELSHDALTPQRIINVSPDIGVYPWLALLKGPAGATWISPAQESGFETLLPEAPGARLAVVVDRPHIASNYPGDRLVAWLNTHAYRLHSRWIEGYEIFHYGVPTHPAEPIPLSLEWPGGVALVSLAAPASASVGAALPVDLTLQCLRDGCATSDMLFTHLLAPDGKVISGQDGPPQYGNLGARGWRAGETALDRRGIWIPGDTAPGEYELIVGFANDAGFVPVKLASGQLADYATVSQIVIRRAP